MPYVTGKLSAAKQASLGVQDAREPPPLKRLQVSGYTILCFFMLLRLLKTIPLFIRWTTKSGLLGVQRVSMIDYSRDTVTKWAILSKMGYEVALATPGNRRKGPSRRRFGTRVSLISFPFGRALMNVPSRTPCISFHVIQFIFFSYFQGKTRLSGLKCQDGCRADICWPCPWDKAALATLGTRKPQPQGELPSTN